MKSSVLSLSFYSGTQQVARFRWMLVFLLLGIAGKAYSEDYVGLVHPVADVQFGVAAAGVVERVWVKHGQMVSQGQTFLELESSAQKLEVQRRMLSAQDNSELDASKARLIVLDELLKISESVASKSQSVSKEEIAKLRLERITALGRLEQLEALKQRERTEIQLAQAELDLRTLKAPRAGMVVEKSIEVGAWAKPGDALFRIVDIAQVELRLNLPQKAVARLRVGDRLQTRFESDRDPVAAEGIVHFVSPVADTSSGLVAVRMRFANPKGLIRPGVKAHVSGLPVRIAP